MKPIFIFSLVILCLTKTAYAVDNDKCTYDNDAMLALDEQAFDQDVANGGWRKIGNIPGCELAAAELIAKVQREAFLAKYNSILARGANAGHGWRNRCRD